MPCPHPDCSMLHYADHSPIHSTHYSCCSMSIRRCWRPPVGCGHATSPFSLKTMEWKPGKKLRPLRFSLVDFRSKLWHIVYTDRHSHKLHTHSATVKTLSVLRSERKFNKGSCCSKSFIVAQGKTYETMFFHVKQCFPQLHVFRYSVSPAQLHISRPQFSGMPKPVEKKKEKGAES